MRLLSLGVAIVAAFTVASCESGRRSIPEGPYCAVTNIGFEQTSENCYLPSLDACRREVIAGNRGFCRPNPRYAGPRR
jgi:hypothetical protein